MAETAVKKDTKAVSFSIPSKTEREFRAHCILAGEKPADVAAKLISEYVKKSGKVSV